MTSRTTVSFRKRFAELPEPVQEQVRDAYRLFQSNPYHPNLHFKQVKVSERLVSVRIGLHYRAVGTRVAEGVLWFWIGYHSDYDGLLARR